jgi:Ca2+-binding RTX toxin-like protein
MGILHQYTGANIAASTEKVGNAGLGGTSELENQIGEVATANKLLSEAIANYPGLLAVEFAPSKDSPIELEDETSYTTQVAVGDFNKDGWLDRVALEDIFDPNNLSSSTTLSLELGDGKGNFEATGKKLKLPGSPSSLHIGELDKDGNLDVVALTTAYDPKTSESLNKITAFKGNGLGKLSVDTTLDLKNASLISLSDLNNDGLDDLSLRTYSPGDYSEQIEVFLRNNKDFTKAVGSPFATNYDPYSYYDNTTVVGDFNNDGFMDRAAGNGDYTSNKTSVSIDLGDKNGNFEPLKNSNIELKGSVQKVVTGNFNGDGNLDLVVQTYSYKPKTYEGESTFSLLLGDGKGKFTLDSQLPIDGYYPNTDFYDANNDGLDDITTQSFETSYGSGIGVYFDKANGSDSADLKVKNPLKVVGGGDVNNDGDQDLVVLVGPYNKPKIQVLLGNGKGEFSNGKTVKLEGEVNNIDLADIDGNGTLDIVANEFVFNDNNVGINQTSVLLGNGKGNFKATGTPVQVKTDAESVVGYFDGDKNLDLVVTRNAYDSYKLNTVTSLLSGSGDGKFGPPQNIEDLQNPQTLLAGDFTGDGKVDLLALTKVTGKQSSTSFEILKGNDKGEFTPIKGSQINLEEAADQIIVGDFDGDGKLDVAASKDNNSYSYPYYGPYPYYGGPYSYSSSQTVSVFLGNGKGKFPKTTTLETKTTGDFALGDFDGDGKVDVAQVNTGFYETTTKFSVLLNQDSVEEPEPKPEATEAVKSAKSYTLKKGEEDLILSGKRKIDGAGNGLDNEIAGNNKANKLEGFAGDDTLTGGKGNDILRGGSGDDVLTGGKNKDRFEFGSDRPFKQKDFGADTITDFKTAQKDSIILSQTTFDKLESVVGKGFSVIAEFDVVNGNNKAKATTSGAFIVYNQKTGDLFYNANGSQPGFGSGGLFATLEGAPELKESDFSIVS